MTAVVAVDSGFVLGLEAPDVAGLVPDTVLTGLGNSEMQMSASNFTESGRAALNQSTTGHSKAILDFT